MNAVGGTGRAEGGWTIIVPVKSLDRAKSRLGPALSPGSRRSLVVAMATDVITACQGSPQVRHVRVVSRDPEIAGLAERLGAGFVTESTPDPATAADPLNAALTDALTGITGPAGVVAADLPELDVEMVSRVLDSAAGHPHSVVVDHRGEGTTMAFWTGEGARVCRFGPGSAERFRTEGRAAVIGGGGADPGAAARDVDVPRDVERLTGRRVGPATAAVLWGVPAPLGCREPAESATMVR